MNSAGERAVEAGARAMNPDAFTLDENPVVQRLAVGLAKEDAEACLRAAFPILAEELAEIALKHSYSNNYFVSSNATETAAEIRARIQQMAEAL